MRWNEIIFDGRSTTARKFYNQCIRFFATEALLNMWKLSGPDREFNPDSISEMIQDALSGTNLY